MAHDTLYYGINTRSGVGEVQTNDYDLTQMWLNILKDPIMVARVLGKAKMDDYLINLDDNEIETIVKGPIRSPAVSLFDLQPPTKKPMYGQQKTSNCITQMDSRGNNQE